MAGKLWITLSVFMVTFFGISGCAVLKALPLSPETTHATPTTPATEIPVTVTSSASPASTLQPPTQAPLPTLSAEGMRTQIINLLQDNGRCSLPCFIGLTPEKTDYFSFHNFIGQFSEHNTPDVYVRIWSLDISRFFILSFKENNTHIFFQLADVAIDESSKLSMITMHGYAMGEFGTTPEGALDLRPIYGDVLFAQTFEYYMLPSILSTYGAPEQTLLATWQDDPDRPRIKTQPFSLVLFYPDQGFFVEYVTEREVIGNRYAGCPSKSHIYLGTWDPKKVLSLLYVAQKAGSVINELNTDYFKSVEDATSLTLDEFYNTFKNPENTTCLETSKDLWLP